MARRYSESEVVATVDGLTVTRLRSWVAAETVRPHEASGRLDYGEPELARLQFLTEISGDFDLDDDAAAMVMSLVDQLHGLRRQMRALAEAVASEPDEVRTRVRLRLAPRRED